MEHSGIPSQPIHPSTAPISHLLMCIIILRWHNFPGRVSERRRRQHLQRVYSIIYLLSTAYNDKRCQIEIRLAHARRLGTIYSINLFSTIFVHPANVVRTDDVVNFHEKNKLCVKSLRATKPNDGTLVLLLYHQQQQRVSHVSFS